jgi:electron transfer flavoprotein alpha subunit
MGTVLVIGSTDHGRLTPVSLEAAGLAGALAGNPMERKGALVGREQRDAATQLVTAGLSEVFVVDDARLESYTGDGQVAAAEAVVRTSGADVVIVPADADAVEWAPRLAARLGAALVPGCLAAERISDGLQVKRAISGGSLHASYRVQCSPAVLLVNPGTFAPAARGATGAVTAVSLPEFNRRVDLLATIPDASGQGPPLKTAKSVVAGGVGVGTTAHWKLVEEAAEVLGAAVGASRAAVEMGLAPASRQVGFSGLKVAPELYIAVGISGALHHLAGITGAKKVVAINKDPEAAIFKASHLGIVGDLAEVIPAFIARVRELKQH